MSYFSVHEAQNCILAHIANIMATASKKTEPIALHAALGRVLAQDVYANRNHPPYDVAAMDGYGVHFTDIAAATINTPIHLIVVDDIRAGQIPQIKVLQGRAARIMTGAPIAVGMDTVVRVEDTEVNNNNNNNNVAILVAPKQGANIRSLGENLKKDTILLTKGTYITAAVLAILAMVKQQQVVVFSQPTVAILATGDELEALDEPLDANKIPDANSHALYAQCKELGIEPRLLGIAPDNPIVLRAKLAEGLRYDILLASGGVSVGHHDFVRPMLAALGINMHFWRVAMRPGHPLAFGTATNGTAVFGLPGNPVASMVCFAQFISPALRLMLGHKSLFHRTLQARLGHDIQDRAGRSHFMRVKLKKQADNDFYIATSTGAQGSGVLMSMALADGLMFIPMQTTALNAGDIVTVQCLSGMEFQNDADLEKDVTQ